MPSSANTTSELKRSLGFTETLAIIFNRIIGSGIFRTPAPIMLAAAGSVSVFYGVWIVGGIATILGAFCYAELVAMLPKSGGPYVYLKEAYPPIVTFLRGWAMFFVSETGSIAAVSLFFAENAVAVSGLAAGDELMTSSRVAVMFLAMAIVILLTAANSFGVGLSGKLQNVFGLLKLALLFAIPVISFSSGFNPGHFADNNTLGWWATALAIGEGLRYSFFAYSGWEGATYVAEEVKDPARNLPRSLFAGIGLVLVLYLVINTGYLNMMMPDQLAESKGVAVDAMTLAIGAAGGIGVALAIMFSTFSNVNTQILVKSRTWYAMARDGLFFRPLAKLHPKYLTPNRSMWTQAGWALILILGASLAENAYEAVIDYFSFTSTVFNVLTFVSIWVLRKKHPEWKRPYRAWGYPLSLIIILAIYMWFAISTLITAFIPSLIGILLTCTGLVYYYLVVKKRQIL